MLLTHSSPSIANPYMSTDLHMRGVTVSIDRAALPNEDAHATLGQAPQH